MSVNTHIERFAMPPEAVPAIRGTAHSVTVTVTSSPLADEVTCELRSKRMSVEQMTDRARFWQEGATVHFEVNPTHSFPLGMNFTIEVTVPEGAEIGIKSSSGSVRLSGSFSDVLADAASGSIHLEGTYGDVQAQTTSGSIGVQSAGTLIAESTSGSIKIGQAGPTRAQTSSGSIKATEITGAFTFASVSGSVKVGSSTGDGAVETRSGSIQIGTVAGSVQVGATSGSVRIGSLFAGAVDAQTSSGSLTIAVAPGTAVLVDVEAGSGTVSSDLQGADPAAHQRTAQVKARTRSGSIRLLKATSEGNNL